MVPVVTEAPGTALINETITIKGSNLDLVSYALIGDVSIELISQTGTEIKLVIPAIFPSETKADLILVYSGSEQTVGVKDFIVTVPTTSDEVLFYPHVLLVAEGNPSSSRQMKPTTK